MGFSGSRTKETHLITIGRGTEGSSKAHKAGLPEELDCLDAVQVLPLGPIVLGWRHSLGVVMSVFDEEVGVALLGWSNIGSVVGIVGHDGARSRRDCV